MYIFVRVGPGTYALPIALFVIGMVLLLATHREFARRGRPVSDNGLMARGIVTVILYALWYGFFEYYVQAQRTLFGSQNFFWYLVFVILVSFLVIFFCLLPYFARLRSKVDVALACIFLYLVQVDLSRQIAAAMYNRHFPFPVSRSPDYNFWFSGGVGPFTWELGRPMASYPYFPRWYLVLWVGFLLHLGLWLLRRRLRLAHKIQRLVLLIAVSLLILTMATFPLTLPF